MPQITVWPPQVPISGVIRQPPARLPFPLGERNCSFFARGRHALWQGVQALGLLPGERVLVPALHHGAEVEALVRAGLEPVFYDVDDRLAPDETELDQLSRDSPRALLLTHYLGFPQAVARWRAWCDQRDLFLIEDAAQAWLATAEGVHVGTTADLAVFSFHKSFGLSDGAALFLRGSPPLAESQRRLGAAELVLRNDRQETGLELGDPGEPPTATTSFLLPRVADAGAAGRRRANYAALLAELGDLVMEPFGELPEGAAPFAFPVESVDVSTFVRTGVAAERAWPAPHPALAAERYPRAAERRARTVLLPVHHELGPTEVERVARAVRPGRPGPAKLTLEEIADLEPVASEWNDLAARARNVFATVEFLSTWWRHFGGDSDCHLVLARDADGRLVAGLPLYASKRRPMRVVRFLGHGPGDQLGPVHAPSDRLAAAGALRDFLEKRNDRWDVLLGQQFPGDEGWAALLGAVPLVREGSPSVRFRGRDWDEFLAGLSPKLRQEVGYHRRRLERNHEIGFRLCDDPDRLSADLDMLFELHQEQWGARGSAFGGEREAFHRDFARLALDRGWLRLWLLEVDGQPVAAKYNFRFAGVEFSYQAGRRQAWSRSSVGVVVLAHALQRALEDGVDEYRFLRGGEHYKYRFSDHDPGLETIALGRWRGGAAAMFAGALVHQRLHIPLKRRREQH